MHKGRQVKKQDVRKFGKEFVGLLGITKYKYIKPEKTIGSPILNRLVQGLS